MLMSYRTVVGFGPELGQGAKGTANGTGLSIFEADPYALTVLLVTILMGMLHCPQDGTEIMSANSRFALTPDILNR
jgi:hypothetical protein